MTFQLKSLGPFRIEKSEEYVPGGQDNSYAEMIRVKGSKPEPPYFMVPSHLFKYSESELGLYLNERKNLWRQLGKLLKEHVDIHSEELMVHFPISMFPEVAKIVSFVRKRSRKTPLSEWERGRVSHLRSYRKDIMRQNDTKTGTKNMRGNLHLTPSPILTFRIKNLIGQIPGGRNNDSGDDCKRRGRFKAPVSLGPLHARPA